MFKAYFDETGLHQDPKVFAIAGYLAPEHEWLKIEEPWKEMLRKAGLNPDPPDFECFHASALPTTLTAEQRENLKANAVSIVINSGLIGIGSAILVDEYALLTEHAKSFLGGPYLLCFQQCILEALRYARMFLGEQAANEDVAFIFDQHQEWGPLAFQMYSKLLADEQVTDRSRLGTITFGNKRKFVPLQAADHLAYETYKDMRGRLESTERRSTMTQLQSWPQLHGRYFDRGGLRLLIEELIQDGKLPPSDMPQP